MKITKLTIKNIGAIADEVIDINKPLLLFYGQILQGKSTILNSVRWVCGGTFPSDIIRRGEKEGSIMLEYDGGMIARSWYVNAKGETVARPITYIKDGKPIAAPANAIKQLMNPFLLDQDHLVKMTELERKRFFSDLFSVDTVEIDKAIWNKANEASALRAKISGYGAVDVTKVEPVDVKQLETQLSSLRKSNQDAEAAHEKLCMDYNHRLNQRSRADENLKDLTQQLEVITRKINELQAWMLKNPLLENPGSCVVADTTAIEMKLREAGAQNVRHEQYLANVKRNEQKQADEKKLLELEAEHRKLKVDKLAKLKEVNTGCKVAGLQFDESGDFTYHGNHAGMLSTSQLMTLSSEISALYPEGLGIELIDRGESLGKSIFTFVKRAEEQKISILATIVGEKPATVPENIGVFVVEEGVIKP